MHSTLTDRLLVPLLFLSVCAVGCNDKATTKPIGDDLTINITSSAQTVEFRGVKFELPPQPAEPSAADNTRVRDGNLRFTWVGKSGTFKDGILTLDGEVYGQMHPGDVVKLSEDGTVTVNGEPRQPSTPNSIRTGGIHFSLSGQPASVRLADGEGMFVDMLGRRCELRDATFFVDGKSYGEVERGDEVKLQADGSILVNGETRRPQ